MGWRTLIVFQLSKNNYIPVAQGQLPYSSKFREGEDLVSTSEDLHVLTKDPHFRPLKGF